MKKCVYASNVSGVPIPCFQTCIVINFSTMVSSFVRATNRARGTCRERAFARLIEKPVIRFSPGVGYREFYDCNRKSMKIKFQVRIG